ncbi:MAG: MATE family efflux transporter, partial [Myxococcota bacterium]|nr:MATE family efflux transporter [Myxococcota bacterium]
MVGWLGATALAAHSIGLNIVSTSFMVVLGLSTAAATLVGN